MSSAKTYIRVTILLSQNNWQSCLSGIQEDYIRLLSGMKPYSKNYHYRARYNPRTHYDAEFGDTVHRSLWRLHFSVKAWTASCFYSMNSNGTLPETWKKNYYKGTRERGKAQIECPKERLLILNKAFLEPFTCLWYSYSSTMGRMLDRLFIGKPLQP